MADVKPETVEGSNEGIKPPKDLFMFSHSMGSRLGGFSARVTVEYFAPPGTELSNYARDGAADIAQSVVKSGYHAMKAICKSLYLLSPAPIGGPPSTDDEPKT